jgi:hypothetical protein
MLTGDVIAKHLDAAVVEARTAEALARDIGVSTLAAFLGRWADTIGAQGAGIAHHYTEIGNEAARLLGAPAYAATGNGG